jgi:hypothetical protein
LGNTISANQTSANQTSANQTSANQISQLSESLRPPAVFSSSPLFSTGSQNQPLPFQIPDPLSANISAATQTATQTPEFGGTDVTNEESGVVAADSQLPLTTTPPATAETVPQAQQLISPQLISPSAVDISLPETTITSVTDNGTENIQNGATSASPTTEFSFEGSDDLGISGYVCTVDGLQSYYCTSPAVVDNNIQIGWSSNSGLPRTFQVSAIDTSGNIDPTPATFNWIMVPAGPQQTLPQPIVPQQTLPQPIVPQQTLPQPIVPQQTLPQPIVPQQTLPLLTLPPAEIVTPQTTTRVS